MGEAIAPAPSSVSHDAMIYADHELNRSLATQQYLAMRKEIAGMPEEEAEEYVSRLMHNSTPTPTNKVPACSGEELNAFFRDDEENDSSWAKRKVTAQLICMVCPIIKECFGMGRASKANGIWGGRDLGLPASKREKQFESVQKLYKLTKQKSA